MVDNHWRRQISSKSVKHMHKVIEVCYLLGCSFPLLPLPQMLLLNQLP